MVKCIAELAACDYWTEWRSIRCPTLVVRAERGYLDERHLAELAHALPHGLSLTIPNGRSRRAPRCAQTARRRDPPLPGLTVPLSSQAGCSHRSKRHCPLALESAAGRERRERSAHSGQRPAADGYKV